MELPLVELPLVELSLLELPLVEELVPELELLPELDPLPDGLDELLVVRLAVVLPVAEPDAELPETPEGLLLVALGLPGVMLVADPAETAAPTA